MAIEVSNETLKLYRQQIFSASSYAANDAMNEMMSYLDSLNRSGKITKEQLRPILEHAAQTIQSESQIWGDVAQDVSNRMFNDIVNAIGMDAEAYFYDDIMENYEEIRNRIWKDLGNLYSPTNDSFMLDDKMKAWINNYVSQRTSNNVHGASNKAMFRNCRRAGISYCVIPSSKKPCRFCVAQASRITFEGGIKLYKQEYQKNVIAGKTMTKSGYFHQNCKCTLMPYAKGVEYEGYNPEEWLVKYADRNIERVKTANQRHFISDGSMERQIKHYEGLKKSVQ